MDGEVIGVNTAILSPNGGSIGIGFSMSSTVVSKVIDQLQNFGETRRGWLGVRIQDVTEDVAEALGIEKTVGALVTDVPDGPAKNAGILSGDVIMEFDDKAIDDTRGLVRIVGDSPVGKMVSVKILRDGKEIFLKVTLGRLEDNVLSKKAPPKKVKREFDFAGMLISDLDDELRKKFNIDKKVEGVVIIAIKPDSTAAQKGLRKGDVIIQVNQVQVKNINQVSKINEKAKNEGKASVLMLILREGLRRFVGLPVQ
jgi:serine protease Do